MRAVPLALIVIIGLLHACASNPDKDTLADLRRVKPDIREVEIDDGLEKALQSYRRFLDETPRNTMTPEAMRRLADLQIEKAYGITRSGSLLEKPALPETVGARAGMSEEHVDSASIADLSESERDFERRATERHEFASLDASSINSPTGLQERVPVESRQAIETYRRILSEYPYYERNDQVLYQLARAYDEVGESAEAMKIVDRLIREYPHSEFIDEVYFRRAEFFFVRKKYLDAEEAYMAVVAMGPTSTFYELALYKLGWTLYKQDLYEDALHRYLALLDYKVSIGYDFDRTFEVASGTASETPSEERSAATSKVIPEVEGEEDERRVADTFRVISLAFSNLGGHEVLNEYFEAHGNRAYENRIYSNLGEFYLSKLRYNDAAAVYRSFTEKTPFHRFSPHFSMRVVEIYAQGQFARLVVESKQSFATSYGLKAEYWHHFDVDDSQQVLSFLKANLKDLANHFHSLYQDTSLEEEQPANYAHALRWYREFLASFPDDVESPQINHQLADVLMEHRDYREAAREYQRTAYDYPVHEKAAGAGYAAIYAHRENLKVVSSAQHAEARGATVDSSLRFADTFEDHEHAAAVLGAAAQDLYEMKDFERAIASGTKLIERHADADAPLRRSAWGVVAHSSFDLALYGDAERAYSQVLGLTAEDDDSRGALFDSLAASIYKQGEQANLVEDYRGAADHFLRIRSVAPASEIRASAEYDAASALIKLEDWEAAAAVLQDFRAVHTEHELQQEVTKQLAFVYRRAGELSKSAQEYERVAADTDDPELRREAMLVAGGLYEKDGNDAGALAVYIRYVDAFPYPVELAIETRWKIAQLHDGAGQQKSYLAELRRIVQIDRREDRTDRTRYLAAKSSLILTEPLFEHFTDLALSQPFAKSLDEKQRRMDDALTAFERLVNYEVAEVTAGATFYMAEIYSHFGEALLESERPSGLDAAEMVDYEDAIEGEAFPFEERAIDVHEKNLELMVAGTFNAWVQRSLDQLAVLMPGRYAKHEISSGFIGSIEFFSYKSPSADELEGVGDVSAAF